MIGVIHYTIDNKRTYHNLGYGYQAIKVKNFDDLRYKARQIQSKYNNSHKNAYYSIVTVELPTYKSDLKVGNRRFNK